MFLPILLTIKIIFSKNVYYERIFIYSIYFFQDIRGIDIIFLLIAKTIAVIYVYIQFVKLRRLGSKYLLGK